MAEYNGVTLPSGWDKELHEHRQQSALWYSNARIKLVVAGRGSGKTELSRRYTVLSLPVIKPWSDPIYVIGLPTYNQAKRVVWPQLESLIPKEWLAKNGKNISELSFKTIFGSKLYVVGMDKPERIEGIQIDGCVLDESSDQKPGVMRTIAPMLTHRDAWLWRIGVPKRTGCGAKEFKEEYDKGLQGIGGRESYTWASTSILTEEQLRSARELLSAKDAMEQLGGEWLGATGAVFYAYDDNLNVSTAADYFPSLPIGVGSDFNVDPMAWVLFHVIDGKMFVFDEIYTKDTNTQATLDYLWSQYGGHRNGWYFFGDASAQSRKTSSATTDHIQIINDKRFDMYKPKANRYLRGNPPLRDRFASTNALMCNANELRRLFINPRCTNLRSDLQQRTFKPGTTELPTKEGELGIGHISDAVGYAIYKMFPIRVNQANTGKVFAGSQVRDLI